MHDFLRTLQSGFGNLAAYLAGHVLLCLLPAFAIAGAMTALVPRASVTRWLGPTARPWVAYPAALAAGSLLAVCSCTVVPRFAGIYRRGAGLGPAVAFLFFAPAGNVLALASTGSILGADFAVARLALCLAFGVGIGAAMAGLFRRSEGERRAGGDGGFTGAVSWPPGAVAVLVALVALLVAGTLKVAPLAATVLDVAVPAAWAQATEQRLAAWVPFDASKGEEGVSLHGALLIALLLALAVASARGFARLGDGVPRAVYAALVLLGVTLLVAALPLRAIDGRLHLVVTGRTLAVGAALAAVARSARRLPDDVWQNWLWESWRFVQQIAGLLLLGVFLVGVARAWLQPEWIRAVAGDNSLLANAAAVGFGVFLYFPTLVEVPVARLFLDLGMHPGPLLAYLMADPELSLQSMLMVGAVLGRGKAAAYVALVAAFSTVAGLLHGAAHDGAAWAGWAIRLAPFAVAATLLGAGRAGRRRAGGAAIPKPQGDGR
ncbi:MAG: permease [Planctomycetota bacterium]